jgi:uncharacterized protein YdeI (YjbR/CyaY-like superfamily)
MKPNAPKETNAGKGKPKAKRKTKDTASAAQLPSPADIAEVKAKADDPMPQETFATSAAWRKWLDRHHAASPGIWLCFAKQASGIASISHAEALETALCYGWIDGQTKRLDEHHWLQKFTQRKPHSIWSRINRQKALDLIERGHMQPAGHAAIERAKANGRWEAAYEGQSKSTIPPDLQAALDASPKAAAFFKTLSSQNRYAILFRLQTAKKPETRASRLAKFVMMLKRGETLH